MSMCPVNGLQETGLNWRAHKTQQEGVGSVLLPPPASHLRASVLPFVGAPMGESTVLSAVAGA